MRNRLLSGLSVITISASIAMTLELSQRECLAAQTHQDAQRAEKYTSYTRQNIDDFMESFMTADQQQTDQDQEIREIDYSYAVGFLSAISVNDPVKEGKRKIAINLWHEYYLRKYPTPSHIPAQDPMGHYYRCGARDGSNYESNQDPSEYSRDRSIYSRGN